MNTNIPRQTDAAYDKPAQTGYQDGYDTQQAPYTNEMQEKQPLHPSTQGGTTFRRNQLEDDDDPPNSSGFRSERDPAAGPTNPDPTHDGVAESARGRFPTDQTNANVPGQTDRGTTGYDDVRPAQAHYQHDGYGNQQQQTPYANEFQERQPVQHSTQGEPLQGRNQFDDNAGATGFRPGQADRGYAGGTHPNAVDSQQMPPNYDSHAGSMYQDQRYPDEKSRVGGPAVNEGKSGLAADTGVGGHRTGMAAGNNFGDQYDHQKTTTGGAGPTAGNTYGDQYDHQKTTGTGTAGPSWRSDPVGKLTTYLSHPSVATTVNQSLSGGPFSSAQSSVAPTSREARHLKQSGKMEEMVGKMVGSETLRQRGQEKVVMGRNLAVQVGDLKQAGKMEAKAHKLRGKGGTTMGGAGGVPYDGRANEEYATHQPTEQPGGMGPAGAQGSQFPRGY
ncbi:hypothetical protein FRC04_002428 [Tulasnella sp. 424]|nr:hypothetical protein FRC04_002428 [Tulasnella sp. 424]KAG8967372.1 hypothetical protein FRC05_002082 [Tulasnella sp. 425]